MTSRPRVVVAGLGDSGLLTALHLARRFEVVGISSKPGLVSGQELGVRLTRPDDWARDYWIGFDRYRKLDGVRTVHGQLTDLDPQARHVNLVVDGQPSDEAYDVLVIATGVSNGFWRRPEVESAATVAASLAEAHERLRSADSIAVIGGGAAAVSAAANVALTWPTTQVDLYFPGERGLPQHHPGVWKRVSRLLAERGVGLHPGHRAEVPADTDTITSDPVTWTTGQEPVHADAVLWTIGLVRPNTDWLPPSLLDDRGFVRVTPTLQLPDHPSIFAIGDVAATDPLRSSARNRADKLLAGNVRALVAARPLATYKPPRHRWGSVLGVQPNGLTVFAPSGQGFRFPAWSVESILQGLIVRRGIYGGVRRP